MRLIDADAIPYTMLYKENWMTRKGIEKQGAWKDDIDGMPTIEERKKGKWIPNPYDRAWDVCSECGTGCKHREYGITPDGLEYVEEWVYLYCPNCGADMRGGECEDR